MDLGRVAANSEILVVAHLAELGPTAALAARLPMLGQLALVVPAPAASPRGLGVPVSAPPVAKGAASVGDRDPTPGKFLMK